MNIKRFNKVVEPEVGDYVIVNYSLPLDKKNKIAILLENSIGQIAEHINYKLYRVVYGTTDLMVNRNEIIEFSKNKEDLEPIIAAKKYNL